MFGIKRKQMEAYINAPYRVQGREILDEAHITGREILDINTLEWEAEEDPVAAFRRECEEIADRLSAEGKPSWGADYELQVEDLRRWYKEQYPDAF